MNAEEAREVITMQPWLWIDCMREEYDRCRFPEAKEAILARMGAVLLAV